MSWSEKIAHPIPHIRINACFAIFSIDKYNLIKYTSILMINASYHFSLKEIHRKEILVSLEKTINYPLNHPPYRKPAAPARAPNCYTNR